VRVREAEGAASIEKRDACGQEARADALPPKRRMNLHAAQNDNSLLRTEPHHADELTTDTRNKHGVSLADAAIVTARRVERSNLRELGRGSYCDLTHVTPNVRAQPHATAIVDRSVPLHARRFGARGQSALRVPYGIPNTSDHQQG